MLATLLAEAGENAAAVFVEDRLLTLEKTMADHTLRTKVLPVLAGWGYNTEEQRTSAASSGYTVSAPCFQPHACCAQQLNLESCRFLARLQSWPA